MKFSSAVTLVFFLWPALAAADDEVAERGRALAEEHCARCHAIGRDDSSRLPIAPAFRELMQRYPADSLAEALAEGIVTGHHQMPEFEFPPDQIEALVRYLDTL